MALKDLPGPKYSLLGCIDVLRRPDPHRWLAEIVNKYGPIVKIRVTTFHVSAWHLYVISMLSRPFCLCLMVTISCSVYWSLDIDMKRALLRPTPITLLLTMKLDGTMYVESCPTLNVL